MDFIKKNLFKIILTVVLLVGFVFATINFLNAYGVTSLDTFESFPKYLQSAMNGAFWTNLGLMIALLGLAVSLILSIFDKKLIASYILIASGVLALVSFILSILAGSDYLAQLKTLMDLAEGTPMFKPSYFEHYNVIVNQVINIVVFALTPILFGVKKVLKTNKE